MNRLRITLVYFLFVAACTADRPEATASGGGEANVASSGQVSTKLAEEFAAAADGVPAPDATFETRVSTAFSIPNVVNMYTVNSTMDVAWFVSQEGGRTVWSNDVVVGAMVHGVRDIEGHATWVISYNGQTRTVNLRPGLTHITTWYGGQRCNVFETGACNCRDNPNWQICGPAMRPYVTSLRANATAASINAQLALEAAGYNVTRN